MLYSVAIAPAHSAPQVPARMELAGIRLQLTKAARARVQEKVDSLTSQPTYFKTLLDRVNLFMPIVERVLQEEGVPADFKYQVIQESACISDAVSSAGAVGFWQFKEPAALSVGLIIDQYADERMHITASTRGAAQYLKMQKAYFQNWLYALLAYYQGRKGIETLGYRPCSGMNCVKIDHTTHGYIIHFLAHKVAFEKVIGSDKNTALYLHEYKSEPGKTLQEIAQAFGIDVTCLQPYNTWLKGDRVPMHTTPIVLIPLTRELGVWSRLRAAKTAIDYSAYWKRADLFPVITTLSNSPRVVKVNTILGLIACATDSLETLAQAGHIALKQFLLVNEIDDQHVVVPGQVYYCKAKNSKAAVHYHIVRPGETCWSIAQKYGIKKKQLLSKNRLRQEEVVQPGRVLWLRFVRPATIPVAYVSPRSPYNAVVSCLP